MLFVHPDQQGSPAVIRDQDGNDHGSPEWTAHGAPKHTPSWERTSDPLARTVRTTYTGHEFDEELGLTNMGGRIYDQKVGRFLQADPIVQAPYSTQGWNRYSYVFNSPLNFVDPSGFNADSDESSDGAPHEDPPFPTTVTVDENGGIVVSAPRPSTTTVPSLEMGSSGSSGPYVPNAPPAPAANGDFNPGQPQSKAGAGDLRSKVRNVARGATWSTLGFGEGAIPFGTIGSDLAPPADPQDRLNLGLGQLAGSVALIGDAAGLGAGGLGVALTGVGVPVAVAAEAAAVAVAVGAAVNAATGIYNIVRGAVEGGGGGKAGDGGGGGEPPRTLDPGKTPVYRGGTDMTARPGEYRVGPDGMVKPTHGVSVNTNPAGLDRFGGAKQIKSMPDGLQIVQRGKDLGHFEITPSRPMTLEAFQALLDQVAFH